MNEPTGLYDKYDVGKKDGTTDPEAFYFVLRLDTDEKARLAALTYVEECQKEDPASVLASDLKQKVAEFDAAAKT